MHAEKGILGKGNLANLGKSKILVPSVGTVGAFIQTDDYPFPLISAVPDEQYDAENVSIVINAMYLNNAIDGNTSGVFLYAVLEWEIAQSLFGTDHDPIQ